MGYVIRLSFANLKQRKFRTVLTIIGIMIGIMSIVTMLTVGIGAKKALVDEVEQVGSTRLITVSSVSTTRKDLLITNSVIERLEKLDKVDAVYPVLMAEGQEKYGNFIGYNPICGVPSEYLEVLGAEQGKLPVRNGSRPELLVGLGYRSGLYNDRTWTSYADSSKGDETLAGKRINFIPEQVQADEEEEQNAPDANATSTDAAGTDREVSGEPEEMSPVALKITGETGNRYEWNIYTDIETLKVFLKRQYPNGRIAGQPVDKDGNPYGVWAYQNALVFVEETADVERISKVIKDMGFRVENNLETLESVNRTISMVQLILGAIGIIAGIVALIGIVNTMMTAVYDRIREIGLLKMLGADSADISFMFLFEAALMGGAGGILGVGLSFIINMLINNKLVELLQMPEGTWIMGMPAWLVVLSVIMSVVVSMLAGVIPAVRATRIKPLEAITI